MVVSSSANDVRRPSPLARVIATVALIGAWVLCPSLASGSPASAHTPPPSEVPLLLLGDDGSVHFIGGEGFSVQAAARKPVGATALVATSSGRGFWVAYEDGTIEAAGDAVNVDLDIAGTLSPSVTFAHAASAPEVPIHLAIVDEPPSAVLFTSAGRVIASNPTHHVGDLFGRLLNAPIVDAALDSDGVGYTLLGADGGVFAFEAHYSGSIPQALGRTTAPDGAPTALAAPAVQLLQAPGGGYWIVTEDGGVFAFGSAPFLGSIPGILPPGIGLNGPIVGGLSYGNGYLLVGSDGGTFNFSNQPYPGRLIPYAGMPEIVAVGVARS